MPLNADKVLCFAQSERSGRRTVFVKTDFKPCIDLDKRHCKADKAVVFVAGVAPSRIRQFNQHRAVVCNFRTVDRRIIFPPVITIENARYIVEKLKKRGYTAEDSDYNQIIVAPESEPENSNRLVLELPRSDFSDEALERLKKIIAGKESLIKKALGADRLPIFSDVQSLRFPWFTLTGAGGETDAYTRFVTALCDMAKRQKRVTATEKESVNDKFDMRVFLIRLGFVGDEYKRSRKILLRNLTGNSSFKGGNRPAT